MQKRSAFPLVSGLLSIGVTIFLAVMFIAHAPGFNGVLPSLRWPWFDPRLPALRIYPWLALAAAPIVLAQALWRRAPAAALGMVCIGIVAMQWTQMLVGVEAGSLRELVFLVHSRGATSYYTDAADLVGQGRSIGYVLGHYAELLPNLHVHSREKPPGPLLFYMVLIRMFGSGAAPAIISAAIISLVTALGAPAICGMANLLLDARDSENGFIAATLFSLVPAIYFHFPQFDACYATVVAAGLICWMRYLRSGDWHWFAGSAALGLLGSFWAYNLLVAGPLLIMLAWLSSEQGNHEAWKRCAIALVVGVATFVGAYGLLWLVTGFDPIHTLRVAMAVQARADVDFGRSFPQTLPIDIGEFVVGVGGGAVIAAIAGGFGKAPRAVWIAWAELGLVAFSALLKCETSRVWIFLIPLALLPAAWEIARWRRPWRWIFYGAMWGVVAAVVQNVHRLGRA
jgi:hypothetical protein